ncbi:hypothetical protein QJS04_geneDACA006338 [Acorus gramineus]|uniref:Uncharacterized protein n=1 Tax=Acorus gramineus TaxID=55184 RepID=A0AAV9AWD9_ACOGR|nr:hypothetical protein QJS04_geneDACA006338 [Acorus gramineus]
MIQQCDPPDPGHLVEHLYSPTKDSPKSSRTSRLRTPSRPSKAFSPPLGSRDLTQTRPVTPASGVAESTTLAFSVATYSLALSIFNFFLQNGIFYGFFKKKKKKNISPSRTTTHLMQYNPG